ncbi:MAG: Crp/Fnr family transcriptional regulator [Chloroflexi bacterium]|nr:Crp/Fnr family transcriptional regulator [Chloroflexota bacterium]
MVAEVIHHKLREISLFQDLSETTLLELAKHARLLEVPAGEVLFDQGDPGDAFYLIDDGQAHIVRKYDNGEEVTLKTLGPFDVVGELSMVVGQPRTGAVVTASDCTLIALDREAFLKVVGHTPGAAMSVLHQLGLRLYHMNLQVREHAIGNAAARVASIILLLAGDKAGEVPGVLRITRMARAGGVDSDTLDRMLREWVRQNFIEYDGRRLVVKNVDALRDIAG